jgi:hypothetical protein
MLKKILTYYKIPLLISATVGITIAALGVARNTLDIIEIIVGIITGTFVLHIEYILYPYLFEPKTDFAKSIFAYVKHKDYGGLIGFINEHKNEIKDKSLNSALFQVILAPFSVFLVYSRASYFVKAFVLSIFANSIYRLIEAYYDGTTDQWFWAIKGNPKKEGVLSFIIVMLLVLVFCLWMI